MSVEQIATWAFAASAAYVYQFLKGKFKLADMQAFWGLFIYAVLVSAVATVIGGGFSVPTSFDPVLFIEWAGSTVGPIFALATILYKGFGSKDAAGEFEPGLGISRLGGS